MGDTGQSTSNGGGSGTGRAQLGGAGLSHAALKSQSGSQNFRDAVLSGMSDQQLRDQIEKASRIGDKITFDWTKYNTIYEITKTGKGTWRMDAYVGNTVPKFTENATAAGLVGFLRTQMWDGNQKKWKYTAK